MKKIQDKTHFSIGLSTVFVEKIFSFFYFFEWIVTKMFKYCDRLLPLTIHWFQSDNRVITEVRRPRRRNDGLVRGELNSSFGFNRMKKLGSRKRIGAAQTKLEAVQSFGKILRLTESPVARPFGPISAEDKFRWWLFVHFVVATTASLVNFPDFHLCQYGFWTLPTKTQTNLSNTAYQKYHNIVFLLYDRRHVKWSGSKRLSPSESSGGSMLYNGSTLFFLRCAPLLWATVSPASLPSLQASVLQDSLAPLQTGVL